MTNFGQHVPDDTILDQMRRALSDAPPDASLIGFVSSRPGEFAWAVDNSELDVLIRITDAAMPPTGPLSLDVVEHERHLPRVKHVGEVSKTLLLRQANARGFDDAAFTNRSGHLSEATIWNLAFWDGETVIWPRAEVLPGVTMQILARRLEALGVPQRMAEVSARKLDGTLAAAVMNSWSPGIPVARIGDRPLRQEPEFLCVLHEAYAREPWNAV